MKCLFVLFTAILLFSCSANRTATLIKNRSVNSADACTIMASNQRHQYRLAIKDARKQKGKKLNFHNGRVIEPPLIAESRKELRLTGEPQFGIIETDETIALMPMAGPIRKEFKPAQNKAPLKISKENGEVIEQTRMEKSITFLKTAGQQFQKSAKILWLIGLAGLVSFGLMKANGRKSNTLSRWGKDNPAMARAIIAGAQVVTAAGTITLGHELYNNGIMIPEYSRWLPVGIITAAASFYPNRYVNGVPAFSFLRRKLHDIALFTGCAMLTTLAGNHYSVSGNKVDLRPTVASISTTHYIALKKNEFKRVNEKDKQKERKGMTKSEKVLSTIAASLLFTFLGLIVAVLSCGLSCNGYAAASLLVGFGGGALVIWGLASIYKRIFTAPTIRYQKEKTATPGTL